MRYKLLGCGLFILSASELWLFSVLPAGRDCIFFSDGCEVSYLLDLTVLSNVGHEVSYLLGWLCVSIGKAYFWRWP